ncbi:MAG: glycosyltransferase [Bryobacteraceae bacterium]
MGIDCDVPETLLAGKGNALCIRGWCYHPTERIRQLDIVAGGIRHPVRFYGTVRADVFSAHYPHVDRRGHSFRSGFWGFVTLPEGFGSASVEILLHARLETGEECTKEIASITVSAGRPAGNGPLADPAGERPLIAICLATYDPPLNLFARQIESLINQSYSNWICIITDDCSQLETWEKIRAMVSGDPRFRCERTPRRLGFYRNFEYSLSLVPDEAAFVALCDHDDYWQADKLESLLAAFGQETVLAFGDMRIVDESGEVLSTTCWKWRRNNFTSLTSLFLANTITGAASMFRRRLLDLVLPFPVTTGEPFHDHWISSVALATGEIAYVDRPLHDYVQHRRNVIGHYVPARVPWLRQAWFALWHGAALGSVMAHYREIYFDDVLRVELMAQVIELRAANLLTRGKRRVVRRLQHMDRSPITALWLPLRRVRELWRGNETVGAETRLFRGILWKSFAIWRARLGPGPRMIAAERAEKTPDALAPLRRKLRPLTLSVSRDAAARVNVLIPTIDFDYVFGGYIAKFNFALKLAECGYRVRVVIVDHCECQPEVWRKQLSRFQGIGDLLDRCEVSYAFNRDNPLTVSADDCFVATTWWTAHIAHQASKDLSRKAFLYLIQEYEPFTFPMGSEAALARESYDRPHYALFSTEFLSEYFQRHRIGVFAQDSTGGQARSATFRNAITRVAPVTLDALKNRASRRLLFYARPEPHASRNMFELGILAVCRAVEEGVFDERWQFSGIGSVAASDARIIPLSNGRRMRLLRRLSQSEYGQELAGYDVGLSLMYTPHPSLTPIEMASAGMLVVTNTFENKTSECLQSISRNLIGVEPTVEGIAAGLAQAAAAVECHERRIAGSQVDWPKDWARVFDDQFMAKAARFLEQSGFRP